VSSGSAIPAQVSIALRLRAVPVEESRYSINPRRGAAGECQGWRAELYARHKELVGDRDPREHEFSIQVRAMDTDKSGLGVGLPVLVAMCGSLLGRNTRGGTIVVGQMNLGGSIETIPTPDPGRGTSPWTNRLRRLLMPVAARRQLK